MPRLCELEASWDVTWVKAALPYFRLTALPTITFSSDMRVPEDYIVA